MTTPPPDKQPAAETLEQIAEGIIRRGLPYSVFTDGEDYGSTKAWLVSHVVTALRNERERAIKILNDARHEGCTDLRELIARIR